MCSETLWWRCHRRLIALKPRVLSSSPEFRLIALDLASGEELPDHQVRGRAVPQVISGRVVIDAAGETVECEPGTLMTFDPGERHALRGLELARLLLMLAPWPAAGHKDGKEGSTVRVRQRASHSEQGERFSERAFSASVSCRHQGRSLFAYLAELVSAHARGDPLPTLA